MWGSLIDHTHSSIILVQLYYGALPADAVRVLVERGMGDVRWPRAEIQPDGVPSCQLDLLHSELDALCGELGVLPISRGDLLQEWLHVLPLGHNVLGQWIGLEYSDHVRRQNRKAYATGSGRWRPASVQDGRAP